MNADPNAQLRLLDLQRIDTALAQLRHRRTTLPELTKIMTTLERAEGIRAQQLDVRTALDDVSTDQRRLENEVDSVRGRATRDNARLSGGGLPSKELESLQHELVSLARRQNDLEDELLAIMQQRETSEIELAGFEKELADIETERGDLERSRNEAFSEIDTTTAKHRAERAELAGDLPADLIALYDKVAVSGGGVGAAALKARRCEGCHLELAGTELIEARAAAPDLVLRCENCRRILIRTPESGL